MFVPTWIIVLVIMFWLGIPLTRWLMRRMLAELSASILKDMSHMSEREAKAFLLDHLEGASPFRVMQFLNQENIHFRYHTANDPTNPPKKGDLCISCQIPVGPPTWYPRYWLFAWEFQVRFEFLEGKLVDVEAAHWSSGYDLVGPVQHIPYDRIS